MSNDAATKTQFALIRRIDEEQRIVTGLVYEPYVLDTWGEFMTPEDIKLMAYRFLKQVDKSKSIDRMHDNVPTKSYPIESFIARSGDPDFPEGGWVMSVKVPEDDLWAEVKRGDLNAFSFQALVRKLPALVTVEMTVDNFGLTEENMDHRHMFWAEFDADGVIVRGRTSTVDGHSHEIFGASATEKSEGHTHRIFV